MSNDIPRQSDYPTFYIYEKPKGEWHRTDERLTREINRHIYLKTPFDTAGIAFYPQWDEPASKSEIRAAWMLRADGTQAARWTWVERDHHKWHASCELTNSGKCRSRVLLWLSYDPAKKFWTKINQQERNQ